MVATERSCEGVGAIEKENSSDPGHDPSDPGHDRVVHHGLLSSDGAAPETATVSMSPPGPGCS